MHLAVADEDERRDIAAQIGQRMHLHGRLGGAERRPREEGETQIDRRRIERVDSVLQVDAERLVRIQPSCDADQALREVAVDAPVPNGVGIGSVLRATVVRKPRW